MPARKRATARPKRSPEDRFLRRIALDALVLRQSVTPVEPKRETQLEAARMIGVTTETLREYVRRGLPQHGAPNRPTYDLREVIAWTAYWEHLQHEKDRRGRRSQETVDHIPMARAVRWYSNRAMREEMEADPDGFVLVPLHPSDRRREERLRIAAKGLPLDETDLEILEER